MSTKQYIEEHDEALKLNIFWRISVVTMSVGIIIAVLLGVYNIRQAKIKRVESALSRAILDSFKVEEKAQSPKALKEKIQLKNSSLAALAKLRIAQINLEQGLLKEAVDSLLSIIKISNSPIELQACARANLLAIALDHPELISQEQIDNYLKHLDNRSIPFYHLGQLLNALHLIQNRNVEDAVSLLQGLINDSTCSNSLKSQARSILDNLPK